MISLFWDFFDVEFLLDFELWVLDFFGILFFGFLLVFGFWIWDFECGIYPSREVSPSRMANFVSSAME